MNQISFFYDSLNNEDKKFIKELFLIVIFLIISSFLLYLFLLNEKPGYFTVKNNYLLFFIALLPFIILSFSYNFFHYYIQENLAKYIEKILYNIYFFKNIIDTEKNKENYQNILAFQSILFTTLILATSFFFSNLSKKILEKGISTFKNENNLVKKNLFFNFIGILLGGILYMIFYFIFLSKKHPIQSF